MNSCIPLWTMQSVFLWCLCCLSLAHRSSATAGIAQSAFGASLAQRRVRFLNAPIGHDVSRTLLTLDANGDGIVSPPEVTSFAMSQGLDAQSASQEFQTMDSNTDGVLDKKELAAALGIPVTASDQVAPVSPVSEGLNFPQPPQQQQQLPQQRQQQQQQQQQQQIQGPPHNTYVASVPAQLSIAGKPEVLAATEAAPAEQVVATRIQSFLESRVSSKKAASEVINLLSLEAQEDSKAELLTRHSIELRANASSIARTASEQALKAGAEAAQKVAGQLLDKISKLELQAKDDEVKAAQLRAKSHADIMHADQLMAVADKALKR